MVVLKRVKNAEIKMKNVKNVKTITKNKKNVCINVAYNTSSILCSTQMLNVR